MHIGTQIGLVISIHDLSVTHANLSTASITVMLTRHAIFLLLTFIY